MHAGNIFSYLIAWLLVKRSGGSMRLRIDDLDKSRCRQEFAEQALRDFELLGLDWSGEVVYQSTRDEAYRQAYDTLQASQECYPCYCTRSDIQAASAPHRNTSVVYPGTCRNLSDDERAARQLRCEAEHRSPSVRIAVANRPSSFEDGLQGTCTIDLQADFGDFVLKRSDGGFAYHLATVVDDAFMGVTHICRGSDLLPSTHAQLFLHEALGLKPPAYAHVPLLMSSDGRRLAKRDHDAGLAELLEAYGTPEGVVGHIAYLAGIVDDDEPCTAEQLLARADLAALEGVAEISWR